MIHLGDFHFLKENFNVIGRIIEGSGFDDTVFQAEVCSSGSLNGVLSGSHHNRSWTVHSIFSEALERLLYERFLEECNLSIPDVLLLNANGVNGDPTDIVDEIQSHADEYSKFKQWIRNEEFGKTAKFWLCLYLNVMRFQHFAHLSVQENNFEMKLICWEFFLPFYFALNKTNYSRYGSYYLRLLQDIEEVYPGLKELLRYKGLLVQAQSRYMLCTAIDQRGEQTINRDAKTTGGIKSFSFSDSSVLKWTLNRSEQVRNTTELLSLAGMKSSFDMYKLLRPSQILRSEEMVKNVVSVLNNEYINPFGSDLDKDQLFNLSSGAPINDSNAVEQILNIRKVGKDNYNVFKKNRLSSKLVKFHDPIKRNDLPLFSSTNKSVQIKQNTRTKTVEINRNIVGTSTSIFR